LGFVTGWANTKAGSSTHSSSISRGLFIFPKLIQEFTG
jgi:hypothetical protein